MNFLNGITILLIYELVGEVITMVFHLPVPGPVIGMILLFITLLLRNSIPKSLDSASTSLLSHFPLLFVPAGVGLITHLDRILNEWLSISLTLVLSTVLTMASTAALMSVTRHLLTKRSTKDV